MKSLYVVAFIVTSFSSPLIAGSAESVTAAIAVVAEPESDDWAGFYVGGAVPYAFGTLTYSVPGSVVYDLVPETGIGGFAGYNFQRDNLVFGGELAYTSGGVSPVGFPIEGHGAFVDIKARVGYTVGQAVVFAVGGGTVSDYREDGVVTWEYFGLNYGAGVDVQINDTVFAGVEYLFRDMTAETGGPQTATSNIQAVQIRVGLSF